MRSWHHSKTLEQTNNGLQRRGTEILELIFYECKTSSRLTKEVDSRHWVINFGFSNHDDHFNTKEIDLGSGFCVPKNILGQELSYPLMARCSFVDLQSVHASLSIKLAALSLLRKNFPSSSNNMHIYIMNIYGIYSCLNKMSSTPVTKDFLIMIMVFCGS